MPWVFVVSWLLFACPDAERCELEVEQGRVLIQDLHEERALRLLEPLGSDVALPPALRSRALVYAGIARMNLGEEKRARSHFRAAMEADPNAALPGWVSRKVRAVFAEVARKMPRAPGPGPLRASDAPTRGPAPIEVATASAPKGVDPVPPPAVTGRPTTSPSHGVRNGVAVGIGAGAVALAAGSVVAFVGWSSLHGQAVREPQALRAQRLSEQATPLWYVGEGLGAGALGLGAGALGVWLF